MKVTSYEISKKLSEIGFKAESDFVWNQGVKGDDETYYLAYDNEENPYQWDLVNPILAYDLETLLEALPMVIEQNGKIYELTINQRVLFDYLDEDGNELVAYGKVIFSVNNRIIKYESLADTAAKLLILLHEKGLIKFGESNDR